MVVSAVSLFSGTVIWSTQKTVERNIFRLETNDARWVLPGRQTGNSFFYPASRELLSVQVNAPVTVEVDEGFSGIELLGDTSLFRGLGVSFQYGALHVGQRPTRKTTRQSDGAERLVYDDSLKQQIKAADLTVRVGIGPGAGTPRRQLDFKNCKKVTCTTPIRGEVMQINLFRVDSANINLQVNAVELSQSGSGAAVIQLSGTAAQVFFSAFMGGRVDMKQLKASEVYVRNGHNAQLDLYASEIANLQGLDSCSVRLSGSPRYTKIREVERVAGRR